MFEHIVTTLALISTLVGVVLTRYVLSVKRIKEKYAHIPGPEKNGIVGFFLGVIPIIAQQERSGVSFSIYIASLFKIYGKTFKMRFLNRVIIATIDSKLIKTVFIDENFKKSEVSYKVIGFPGGERYLGHGLVSEMDHDNWKHRRALFNPGFQRKILMTFMSQFNEKADALVKFLKTKADGKTQVVLLDEFNHAALDIIASVAFSMKVDTINHPENKFNEYIFESLAGLTLYFQDPFVKFKPHKWPAIMRHRKGIRYLRDTGRKQIVERLEMLKNGQELPNDILTTILKSHENEEFDLENMVDDFVTFFIAGQETTATLLSSLFLELGRNKEVFEKLKAEIDLVVEKNTEIKFDDIHELKYTGCCIKEALRLWPPATFLTRDFVNDIKLGGDIIPGSATIGASILGAACCDEYFEDALTFKPERFDKNENESVTKNDVALNYVYFPFSLGSRNCIGQNFAQIEAKVMIAKFIQNFDFKLDPNQSFGAIQTGTLRPKDGTKCYLSLRND